MPLTKIAIISIFLLILGSLAFGLLELFRSNNERKDRTVKALTVRVLLSIALVAIIGILYQFGLLVPNR